MGLARIFGFCAAFLFASSVVASTIDVGPSDWRNFGSNGSHTPQGVKSTFGQNVRLPPTISGPTRVLPVSRNPVIPYGSVANGLRNFTRINPASVAASAAITALFMGLDWVFDEELDSWMKQGLETAPPDSDYYYWSWTSVANGGVPYSAPIDYCAARYESYNPSGGFVKTGNYRYFPQSHRQGICYVEEYRSVDNYTGETNVGTVYRYGDGCPSGYSYSEELNACARGSLIDLDPSDWTVLENTLPSADPQVVSNAARDAMRRQGAPLNGYTDTTMEGPSSVSGPDTTSTSTDPVTGDTVVTNTSTQTNITYGDTTITTTNTTTSTTYQNGQETGTTVTTETPGELPVSSGGGAGDWPGFCEWASVVCDWFNWTQEEPPPEQDLPSVIDDDFYQEKTISFGAKSCPPDHQIDLTPFLATSVALSFQPLCDFAGLIYYMVMAASYIIAAYITIGVARNG